jgi:hypothetical protein
LTGLDAAIIGRFPSTAKIRSAGARITFATVFDYSKRVPKTSRRGDRALYANTNRSLCIEYPGYGLLRAIKESDVSFRWLTFPSKSRRKGRHFVSGVNATGRVFAAFFFGNVE